MVHLILIGFVAVGILAFRRLPGRTAALAVAIVGLLFLPEVQSKPANPDAPAALSIPCFRLTKLNAIATALVVGSLLFDRRRWHTTRPEWFDLPVVVWCLSPAIATLANALVYNDPISPFEPALLPADAGPFAWSLNWLDHLGVYDALSQTVDQVLVWGVPWWIGRLYLADRDGLRDLALAVTLGGLAYVPFCLLETRVSPQLHNAVYGFHAHDFSQTQRLGGWRPTVFMEHGLAVGMWMTAATLAAFWLWWAGGWRGFVVGGYRLPAWFVVALLAGTAVLVKSSGALALGAVGVAVLLIARHSRMRWPVALLLAAGPLYVIVRTGDMWDAGEAVSFIESQFDADRAASLAFRLRNEDLLVEKALERPTFGWGGFGRSHVYDDTGKDITVTDGLWIIALGERGFLGLASLGLLLLLPPTAYLWRGGSAGWTEMRLASAAWCAVLLGLVAVDSVMNAMIDPVFTMAAGGLAGLRPGREPEE